jgi:hypothetical protein
LQHAMRRGPEVVATASKDIQQVARPRHGRREAVPTAQFGRVALGFGQACEVRRVLDDLSQAVGPDVSRRFLQPVQHAYRLPRHGQRGSRPTSPCGTE